MAVFPIEKTPLIQPQDKMWLSASYLLGQQTALPTDGTAVSNWVNLDGRIMTCNQPSGTSQPLFKTNIFAGRPAILLDGNNDGLVLTGISGFTAAQRFASTAAFTLAMVFMVNNLTTVNGLTLEAMRGAAATDKTTLGIDAAGNLYWEVNNGGVITTIATTFTDTTKPHIVLVTNDGASGLTMYLDGTQITGGTATSGTSGVANTAWFGNVPSLTRPFSGYIFDAYYSSGVISSAQRTSITRFFANFNGVAI